MFERFTDTARNVVILAKETAVERHDDQIQPAYLLYALTRTGGVAARALAGLGVDGAAVEQELDRAAAGRRAPLGDPAVGDAEALAAIGIDLDEIRRKVEESFGPGALQRAPATSRGLVNWTGRRPLSDQSKMALAASLKEARALRHNYIGSEHLLLGLLRVAERSPHGDFAAALGDLRLDTATARARALSELAETHISRGQADT